MLREVLWSGFTGEFPETTEFGFDCAIHSPGSLAFTDLSPARGIWLDVAIEASEPAVHRFNLNVANDLPLVLDKADDQVALPEADDSFSSER